MAAACAPERGASFELKGKHDSVALLGIPGALQQVDRGTLGVRLCLGHPPTEAELEKAMTDIRRILDMTETISFV